MKSYSFEIDGNKFEVSVPEITTDQVDVEIVVNDEIFKIKLKENIDSKPIKPSLQKDKVKSSFVEKEGFNMSGSDDSSGDLKSLMPGKITKILVEKGQKVKMGEPVLMLESMKMEQTIVSTKSGIIDEIKVSVGDSVETGYIMLKIK